MLVVEGGGAAAEVTDEVLYLAVSLRNAGSGIAVLHGWQAYPELRVPFGHGRGEHPPLEDFTPLTRDLYVPVGDVGFWQGSFRDRNATVFAEMKHAIEAREQLTVDVLYGDLEGGQRVISRFAVLPRDDGAGWIATVGRHWNVDRADPR
jgi:hypothetical protein